MDRPAKWPTSWPMAPPLVFAAIKEITRDTAHLPVQQAFDLVIEVQAENR